MAYNNNFYLFDDVEANNYNPYVYNGYNGCNGYPPCCNNGINRIGLEPDRFIDDDYYLDDAIRDLLILKRRRNYPRRCCNRCDRF